MESRTSPGKKGSVQPISGSIRFVLVLSLLSAVEIVSFLVILASPRALKQCSNLPLMKPVA